MDEIAALGLRHVGYAVPIELFEPFVEGASFKRWLVGWLVYGTVAKVSVVFLEVI